MTAPEEATAPRLPRWADRLSAPFARAELERRALLGLDLVFDPNRPDTWGKP